MAATPPPPTPEALFERWRRYGDAAALGALFDVTSPALFRIALALLPDAATAEDALQETYLAAMQHAEAHDATRPVVPWLVGILQNMARRQRRSRARVPDPVRLAAAGASLPEADALGEAERVEEAARLRAAIDALDEPYRGVALLRWRYGLEPAEIADVRNEPPGTTRSLLSRALGRLRGGAGAAPAVFAGVGVPRGLAAVREGVLDALLPAGAGAAVAGGLLFWKAVAGVSAAALVGVGGWLAWQGWTDGGPGAAGAGPGEVARSPAGGEAPPPPADGPGLRGNAPAPAANPDRAGPSRVSRAPGPAGDVAPPGAAAGEAAAPATGPAREGAAVATPEVGDVAADLFRAEVAAAIRSGASWLAKRQLSDGSWSPSGGLPRSVEREDATTAQALYALLRAGVPDDDPVVVKGFEWLRKKGTLRDPRDASVVPASWALLASAARLAAQPVASGIDMGRDRRRRDEERAAIRELSKRLDQSWTGEGWFAVGPSAGPRRREGDLLGLSTAALARAAAFRSGLAGIPTAEAPALLEHLLARQEARGTKHPRAVGARDGTDVARGFRDGPAKAGDETVAPTAWSTAAALVALHVAWDASGFTGRRRLPAGWTEGRVIESVQDGYAWLDLSWPVAPLAVRARDDLAWCVEVERLTALLGADAIGAHDAFTEIARALLAARGEDGAWTFTDVPADPRATIQALLVLTRSTRPIVERPFLGTATPPPK